MFDILQFETSFQVSSIVLIVMGCISLILSLMLYRKSRSMGRLSDNASVTVFKRIFNVFDPYPKSRKTINENIELLILLTFYGGFIASALVISQIFEMGLVLSGAIFIICLSMLMIDEIIEIHKNSNLFSNAIKNGVDLGKGDVETLHLLKKVLPKLTTYYAVLAVVFFASSLTLPYIIDAFLLVLAQVAPVIFMPSALFLQTRFYLFVVVSPFVFVLLAFSMHFAVGKIKRQIFGFPSPIPINSLMEQFHRMKTFVRIMHHHPFMRVPEPEKPKKSEEKSADSG